MITSGSLSGAQEVLASWIAKDRNKNGHYFTSRVPKMALYGAFVSAPLGHILINILQKAFAGRTSAKAKILQILASNLIVCIPSYQPPSIYLTNLLLRLPPSKTPSISQPWPSSQAPALSTKSALPFAPVSSPS